MSAPSFLSLRHWFQTRASRGHPLGHRLSLALLGSLLIHASLFLGLALSRDGSIGTGQSRAANNAIYAVLHPAYPDPQVATLAPSRETAAGADRRVDKPSAIREKPSAAVAADRRGEQGAHGNPERSAAAGASAAAPAQASPRYLFGTELSRQARLLNEIDIVYPPAAGVQEGKVTLRILVSESGAIDDVAVIRAEPRGFFEEAARSAFARAEFSPGESLGKAVKSQFFVEVEFVPFNRGETSGKAY